MIGLLSGTLLEVQAPNLLLDVNGVGYEVEVSATVLAKAPMVGERMTLATHFVVREDAQLLFGFDTKQERDLLRGFIKISGVGPKLALALISALDPNVLADVVRRNDISMLTKVPGVGKKTAERLMLELKNRIDEFAPTDGLAVVEFPRTNDVVGEAEDALVALGYRPAEASRAVSAVLPADGGEIGVEDLVRAALRQFAQTASQT